MIKYNPDKATDSFLFFQPGIIKRYSPEKRKPYTSDTVEEAFTRANKYNTRKYVLKNIIEVSHLYSYTNKNNHEIITMQPTSSYSYVGIMVILASAQLKIDKPEKIVPTTFIYDYDSKTQEDYFRQIIVGLDAMQSTFLSNEKKNTAYAVENTIISVSTSERIFGRSVGLPHTHIIKTGEDIDTKTKIEYPDHLLAEQNALKNNNWFKKFSSRYIDLFKIAPKTSIQLQLRSTAPYGYTLSFPVQNTLNQNVSIITKIMNHNHFLYKKIIPECLPLLCKNTHISPFPQPSYRAYISKREKKWYITISPALFSFGGVLEVAGLVLYRDPSVVSPYSQKEIDSFFRKLQKKLLPIS